MLWECWLIFLIQKIKTGLSASLRLVPREYLLASMSMLASVSHLLHVLHFWSFFLLIRYTDVVLSLFLSLVHLTTDNWVWHMVSYADQTVKSVQTGSSVSATEKCSTSYCRVSLSQQSLLPWFKGLLHCLQEKEPSSCCALCFITGSSLWWVIACQLELWLTSCESINKYDLILIKPDETWD